MIELNCIKSLNGANGKFDLDVNLNVKKGEFVALYGKSGSGKTTLLRLIAGFETPDSGTIKAGGRTLFDGNNFTPPQSRNIGFLFQDYALFPNMNVMKNLLFANDDVNLARKLLGLVEMSSLENAAISQLSGGQKQRAALARALMRKPEILLLDEPLSALDNAMRKKLQDYLAKVHAEFDMTTILVSHDVAEIYKLASKVFVLEGGKIAQEGSSGEIFLRHNGSQKFSLPAKILEISKRDAIYVAVVSVGQQLCEVALSAAEAANLKAGDEAVINAKAFGLNLQKSGSERGATYGAKFDDPSAEIYAQSEPK
jgi:spermidine/putrescine ABC transporter, ATP-binding protein PotA